MISTLTVQSQPSDLPLNSDSEPPLKHHHPHFPPTFVFLQSKSPCPMSHPCGRMDVQCNRGGISKSSRQGKGALEPNLDMHAYTYNTLTSFMYTRVLRGIARRTGTWIYDVNKSGRLKMREWQNKSPGVGPQASLYPVAPGTRFHAMTAVLVLTADTFTVCTALLSTDTKRDTEGDFKSNLV